MEKSWIGGGRGRGEEEKGKGAPRRIGVLSNVFSLRKKREVKDSSEEAA